MPDLVTLSTMAVVFMLAGTIKGIVGLGLPAVSVGLLTAVLDLPTAMVLMLVPAFVINLWQASSGGYGARLIVRLWPFLLAAIATIWLGAAALTRVNLAWLSGLLGVLMVVYAAVNLIGFRLNVAPRRERWAVPLLGVVNGILTGMTGTYTVPGVMYLQGLGLPRDEFVQAMGILFTMSTLGLAVALHASNLLTAELGALSVAALAPVAVGVALGRRLRQLLTEDHFRRVFFAALLILGAYIIGAAVVGAR